MKSALEKSYRLKILVILKEKFVELSKLPKSNLSTYPFKRKFNHSAPGTVALYTQEACVFGIGYLTVVPRTLRRYRDVPPIRTPCIILHFPIIILHQTYS